MGFNGTFVVIRHRAVPADLVVANKLEPGSDADTAGCRSAHDPSDWARVDGQWSHGWRVWTYYGQLPTGYPQALMDATSAPTLTGYVVGSDATRIEGLGPRTGRWAAWQMVWRTVGYFSLPMAYDEDEVSDEEAVELNHQAELAGVQRLLAEAPGGSRGRPRSWSCSSMFAAPGECPTRTPCRPVVPYPRRCFLGCQARNCGGPMSRHKGTLDPDHGR